MIDYSKLSERELEQIQTQIGQNNETLRVFIADIVPKIPSDSLPKGEMELHSENMQDRMRELENLVTTYGGVVILEHIQKRGIPDYNTYIGSGKLDEIVHEMQLQNANLLIVGNILKPHQIYKLNERLRKIGAVAWDRVDLILKIFERNAKTEETKLQIELAAIKHMGPRIFNMGMQLGKQGGKGSGETNTEIMKRHLENREKDIRKKLSGYSQVRENHRAGRKRKGFLTVGIVGYTNAGKSALLNVLTQKGTLSEDKLFATLGTSVGKMWLPAKENSQFPPNYTTNPHPGIPSPLEEREAAKQTQKNEALFSSKGEKIQIGGGECGEKDYSYHPGKEVLLSDTIGFIRDLPPELVDAFASTLEDSIESDILFHVVDSSDPKLEEKMKVVDDILQRIGASQEKIYIFNKIDAIPQKRLQYLKKTQKDKKVLFVSAKQEIGLDEIQNFLYLHT